MTMTAEERRIEELLLHLRGLVFVRAILEQRGASELELERHASEIALARARLAWARVFSRAAAA
jgi:hypothetical protein